MFASAAILLKFEGAIFHWQPAASVGSQRRRDIKKTEQLLVAVPMGRRRYLAGGRPPEFSFMGSIKHEGTMEALDG